MATIVSGIAVMLNMNGDRSKVNYDIFTQHKINQSLLVINSEQKYPPFKNCVDCEFVSWEGGKRWYCELLDIKLRTRCNKVKCTIDDFYKFIIEYM